MDIIALKRHSTPELIAKLKEVPLLKQPEIFVYQQALVTLEQIHTDCLHPAQNYLWLQELKKTQELRWSLAAQGVDLFKLDGYVTYTVRQEDGTEEVYDLYPPIVEESLEADGTLALVINDGMHRLYLARLEWVVPQVAYIRGVPKAYPYYAYPRREGWAGLDLLAENPNPRVYLKKCHRQRDNKKALSGFPGGLPECGPFPE